jgi:hypothetical protein
MPPALAEKVEKRNRHREPKALGAADVWATPDLDFSKSLHAFKQQMRRHGSRAEGGQKFRSPALKNDVVISKIRARRDRPRRGWVEGPSILPLIRFKQEQQASARVSGSSLLDRTAAEVKRLAGAEQPSDEDFIRVARILREAMKNELHSDPPMADVCLVVADALTFTSPSDLQPGALRVLDSALQALGKPRGEEGDEGRIFSQLIDGGWRVTPAYDETELAAWIADIGS